MAPQPQKISQPKRAASVQATTKIAAQVGKAPPVPAATARTGLTLNDLKILRPAYKKSKQASKQTPAKAVSRKQKKPALSPVATAKPKAGAGNKTTASKASRTGAGVKKSAASKLPLSPVKNDYNAKWLKEAIWREMTKRPGHGMQQKATKKQLLDALAAWDAKQSKVTEKDGKKKNSPGKPATKAAQKDGKKLVATKIPAANGDGNGNVAAANNSLAGHVQCTLTGCTSTHVHQTPPSMADPSVKIHHVQVAKTDAESELQKKRVLDITFANGTKIKRRQKEDKTDNKGYNCMWRAFAHGYNQALGLTDDNALTWSTAREEAAALYNKVMDDSDAVVSRQRRHLYRSMTASCGNRAHVTSIFEDEVYAELGLLLPLSDYYGVEVVVLQPDWDAQQIFDFNPDGSHTLDRKGQPVERVELPRDIHWTVTHIGQRLHGQVCIINYARSYHWMTLLPHANYPGPVDAHLIAGNSAIPNLQPSSTSYLAKYSNQDPPGLAQLPEPAPLLRSAAHPHGSAAPTPSQVEFPEFEALSPRQLDELLSPWDNIFMPPQNP